MHIERAMGSLRRSAECIGHGGMPVELNPEVNDHDCHKALKFFDNRQYDSGEGIDVGFNGFAHLTFDESAPQE